jgi:hypothetical protein
MTQLVNPYVAWGPVPPKKTHVPAVPGYVGFSMVQRGVVELQYISTDEKIADILTKPLSRVKYEYFKDKLGVMQNVHPR